MIYFYLYDVITFHDDPILCKMDILNLFGKIKFLLYSAFRTAPFMPNLLNSTVFLVETSQMISVFFANYKGRPWMKGAVR